MLKPPRPYRLRRMRLSDISSVMDIERDAFPVPWNESAYHYEVAENPLASYEVLTVGLAGLPAKIIGYAGFWMLVDEAHISTIAVDTDWRSHGLGGLLLISLLVEAYKLEASLATLEVRKSNIIAQAMYHDFNFITVGGRRRYYQGREDAIIMSIDPLDKSYRTYLHRKEKAIYQRFSVEVLNPSGTAARGRDETEQS